MMPDVQVEVVVKPFRVSKTFSVCQVPCDEVDASWPWLNALFEAGPEEYKDDRHRAIVKLQLIQQKLTCWIVTDETELVMAVLTELRDNEFDRSVYVVWGLGKRMEDYFPLVMSALEDYAVSLDAVRVHIEGRLGWERWLAPYGYKRVAVVFRKDVKRQRSN